MEHETALRCIARRRSVVILFTELLSCFCFVRLEGAMGRWERTCTADVMESLKTGQRCYE